MFFDKKTFTVFPTNVYVKQVGPVQGGPRAIIWTILVEVH